MLRLINFINKIILLIISILSIINSDIDAFIAAVGLALIYRHNKCVSLSYLMLIFNLHFSLRYVEIGVFSLRNLFEDDYFIDVSRSGSYMLLASLFYLIIWIIINLCKTIFSKYEVKANDIEGVVFAPMGAISMALFSISTLTGAYRIGIDVGDALNRLIMRISNFLNYYNPAVFFYRKWFFFIGLFSISSLFFGSKAFIYNIGVYVIQFGLAANIKIKKLYLFIFMILLLISFFLFNIITSYRISGIYDFSSVLNNLDNFQAFIKFYSFTRTRWGGLDTLIAYGDSGYTFGGDQIFNEVIIAINNLMPPFMKLPMPENYISSELVTGYIFRGYDFFSVIEGQPRTTDSMYGISRFIVGGIWGYLLLIVFLLISFFMVTKNYFLNLIVRMVYFNSILIGGTYNETIRISIELFIFILLYKLGVIAKLSNFANRLFSYFGIGKLR